MFPLKIIETPRDALQGIEKIIPTDIKIEYINSFLRAGFDTVEVGSFVSAGSVPQMSDTSEVLKGIKLPENGPRIMTLVANRKGIDIATEFDAVTDISFPFSASRTFLKKNINRSFEEALSDIDYIQNKCIRSGKVLNVYITMAFGNPYGDAWNIDELLEIVILLKKKGITCIPLSDITGEADALRIYNVFSELNREFAETEFGLHLHCEKFKALPLVESSWKAGCRRFDTVLGGLGGCPMTGKELLANLDTHVLINFLESINIDHRINKSLIENSVNKIIYNYLG